MGTIEENKKRDRDGLELLRVPNEEDDLYDTTDYRIAETKIEVWP